MVNLWLRVLSSQSFWTKYIFESIVSDNSSHSAFTAEKNVIEMYQRFKWISLKVSQSLDRVVWNCWVLTTSQDQDHCEDLKSGKFWLKLKLDLAAFRQFLFEPGMPGVQAYVSKSKTFCRLNWCDSGWWRYQLNTIMPIGSTQTWNMGHFATLFEAFR